MRISGAIFIGLYVGVTLGFYTEINNHVKYSNPAVRMAQSLQWPLFIGKMIARSMSQEDYRQLEDSQ